MPDRPPLSPAAQAVLDAFNRGWKPKLAAALRAAADQVVPKLGCTVYGLTAREHERQQVRRELLAIAAELEAQP